MIRTEKVQLLDNRLKSLEIHENDLVEQFVRGSGAGGQKINKTSVAVLLTHVPTGIQVRCQQTRSQADNRYFARRLLADKIEAKIRGEKSQEQKLREKIRRQKRKRSRRAKEKMLRAKKIRSERLRDRQADRQW